MMIKHIIFAGILLASLGSCNNENEKGKFSLSGDVKNLPDQQVYLDEIFFDNKEPEVVDTAEVKAGKFTMNATALQEGIFRVRFQKSEAVFLVVNDKPALTLTADNSNLSLKTVSVNSPANASLKGFITESDKQIEALQGLVAVMKNFERTPAADSQFTAMQKQYDEKDQQFVKYVTGYIDTCVSSTNALFAIGYIAELPAGKLEKPLATISKRFPGNSSVAFVVKQFNDAKKNPPQQQPNAAAHIPQPGDMAPEITMPDTDGNMFSLSSLRGKYVLVDFWASWCGPCRAENPNVVNAFNKYSSKNFTVLGVSLDKKKEFWLEAIKKDGLNWKHISDLKQWESEAQQLYQFQGIPYNVLVDPQGKILAVSLRGEDLDAKLAEVLK